MEIKIDQRIIEEFKKLDSNSKESQSFPDKIMSKIDKMLQSDNFDTKTWIEENKIEESNKKDEGTQSETTDNKIYRRRHKSTQIKNYQKPIKRNIDKSKYLSTFSKSKNKDLQEILEQILEQLKNDKNSLISQDFWEPEFHATSKSPSHTSKTTICPSSSRPSTHPTVQPLKIPKLQIHKVSSTHSKTIIFC